MTFSVAAAGRVLGGQAKGAAGVFGYGDGTLKS
ncbi:hypothetical protein E2C01_026084 [Portunus trituberculatus]|uniref:Uncharacterized protein n=1 Tax=Portunus trituberculatus TaxID=210409 RepID=A0A5B7EHW1_PORTR|nr:hypothetical protein [Portunus trituberculatus]